MTCRGSWLGSQHPHDGSQLPIAPVPGAPGSSSDLRERTGGAEAYMQARHTQA